MFYETKLGLLRISGCSLFNYLGSTIGATNVGKLNPQTHPLPSLVAPVEWATELKNRLDKEI